MGNPVASRRGFELTLSNRPSWCYERVPSALRYLHQSLDWPGLARRQADFLPRTQERAFASVASGLGLRFELGDAAWVMRESRFVPDEDHSGFGPVGFAAFLASPAVLLASAFAWARSRRPELLVRALIVAASLGWFAGFLLSPQPWIAEAIRYFLAFVPLLVAALAAQGSGTRWGAACGLAAAALALVTAVAVTVQGPGGVRRGAYRAPGFGQAVSEEVIASLSGTLPSEFPDGARIGVVSEFNDVLFHLLRSVPRLRFVPVAEGEIPALLRSGWIDGAVVGQYRNEAGQGWTRPGIPLPRNAVIVRDPERFFREHPRQYRFALEARDGRNAARMALGSGKRWEGGTFHLRLPAELTAVLGGPVELVLPADRDCSADGVEATCSGTRAAAAVESGTIRVSVPAACAAGDGVLMDIVLARREGAGPLTFRGDAWALGGHAGR